MPQPGLPPGITQHAYVVFDVIADAVKLVPVCPVISVHPAMDPDVGVTAPA
jgi:hypothetical protein